MEHLIVEFCAACMQNLKLQPNKMKEDKSQTLENNEKSQSMFLAYYNPIPSFPWWFSVYNTDRILVK